jgi:hypothetical protein
MAPAFHSTRILIALIALGLSTLAASCQPVRPEAPAQHDRNSVIFTAQQTEAERAAIDAGAEDTWTPTEADVMQLEEDLLPFLRQAEHPWLRPDPPIWERVIDYKRQYLGLIVAGERVVYANFFCSAHEEVDWQRELVFVLDGGDCYFRVKYKPDTGEFYDLDVNGES